MWDGALSWCNNRFFFGKVRCKVFSHFQEVAVKRYSSIRNWPVGLPGLILCEELHWCQRKVMLLNLPFARVVFSSLGEFGLTVHASGFLPITHV
jgi:hypothetical protein